MPSLVFDNPAAVDSSIVFNGETSPKAGELLDIITGQVACDGGWAHARTVLLFCHYKEAQYALQSFLERNEISTRVMNGDTPEDERREIIKDYGSGRFRVLITNVMKGLNFGFVNHVVMYSTPGNTNNMVQFEGRFTRDFDIVDKHLLVLVTDGKEEDRFSKILSERAKASDKFAGSDHSMILDLLLQSRN